MNDLPQRNTTRAPHTCLLIAAGACGLFLSAMAGSGIAQPPDSPLCLTKQWPWGPCQAVAADHGLAVAGSGCVARVVDLSVREAPQVAGELVLPAAVTGVAIQGRYALVAQAARRLHIVDLQVPSAPVEVGVVALPDSAHRIVISGDHAFAVMWRSGVMVVDIADPEHPRAVAHIAATDYVGDLAISGSHAYLASGSYSSDATTGQLVVVDISDPTDPVELGTAMTTGAAGNVALSGGLAFVTAWEDGLAVVDVGDPSSPAQVAYWERWMRGTSIAIDGSVAYISEGNQGLILADISDPMSPVELATVNLGGWSYQVVVSETSAFVATGDAGLQVVRSDPPTAAAMPGIPEPVGLVARDRSAPQVIATLDAWPWSRKVTIEGPRIYLETSLGLYTFDRLSAGAPPELGHVDLSDLEIQYSAITDDRLYLVARSDADRTVLLLGYDIEDPASAQPTGILSGVYGIIAKPVVYGNHVILAQGWEEEDEDDYTLHVRLRVVEFGREPVEVAALDFVGWTSDLERAGRYLYIADHGPEQGIRVVDLGRPTDPAEVGWYPTPWRVVNIEVCGQTMSVIDGSSLHLFDLSEPTVPQPLGSVEISGSTWKWALAVAGDLAVVGDFRGVHLVDIRDPSAPKVTGFQELPAGYDSIDTAWGVVYVAAGSSGLQVFSPCLSPSPRDPSGRTVLKTSQPDLAVESEADPVGPGNESFCLGV